MCAYWTCDIFNDGCLTFTVVSKTLLQTFFQLHPDDLQATKRMAYVLQFIAIQWCNYYLLYPERWYSSGNIYNHKNVPIDSLNSGFTGSKVLNFPKTGLGNIQRNLWQNPRSALLCCSMRVRATDGCVNPPTVRAVRSIWKFAWPVTAIQDLSNPSW